MSGGNVEPKVPGQRRRYKEVVRGGTTSIERGTGGVEEVRSTERNTVVPGEGIHHPWDPRTGPATLGSSPWGARAYRAKTSVLNQKFLDLSGGAASCRAAWEGLLPSGALLFDVATLRFRRPRLARQVHRHSRRFRNF